MAPWRRRRCGASRPRRGAGGCGGGRRRACARRGRAPGRRRSWSGRRAGSTTSRSPLTALGLAAELLRGRWTRAAVTGLVVDLGDRYEPQRAEGGPGADSRRSRSPGRLSGRRWGRLGRRGRPTRSAARWTAPAARLRSCATRVHRSPPLCTIRRRSATPSWSTSVTAAARLAIANVRLQAEIAARVREVAASRRRLVEAGDDERRRLGEELRDGCRAAAGRCLRPRSRASRRCATLRPLRPWRSSPPTSTAARADLTRFAQGIHPRALTDGGLHGALAELGAQAAVPVTLDVTDRRFPPAHEAAAFFVCSEGLTNVAKHASAARVEIAVRALGSTLTVRGGRRRRGGRRPRARIGSARARRPGRGARRRTAHRQPPRCRHAPGGRASDLGVPGHDLARSVGALAAPASSGRRSGRSLAVGLYVAVAAVTVAIVRSEPGYALAGDSATALAGELAAGALLVGAALIAGRGGRPRSLPGRSPRPASPGRSWSGTAPARARRSQPDSSLYAVWPLPARPLRAARAGPTFARTAGDRTAGSRLRDQPRSARRRFGRGLRPARAGLPRVPAQPPADRGGRGCLARAWAGGTRA